MAEEAARTAELMGNYVTRLYDVGVAGLHRIPGERARLATARVVIVVAGMLKSCASGVSVANIDNGFGAANIASLINL